MRSFTLRVTAATAIAVLLGLTALANALAAQHNDHHDKSQQKQAIQIPSALKAEHAEIHGMLEAAAKLSGNTGEAARALVAVLHPHFEREEQIALPPLGLLQRLLDERYTADMAKVLPLTDSLRAELPRMLDEHKKIAAATRRLGEVAKREGQTSAAHLAEQLLRHAQNEEQVTYPAAILVGEVVRARAAAPGSARLER